MVKFLKPAAPQSPANQATGSQYDFILNAGAKPPKGKFSLGSGKTSRLILILVGLVGMVILTIVVVTVLGSVDRAVKDDWLTALKQQQEIIRISEIGIAKARGSEAANLAITTNLSFSSSKGSLTSLASKAGVKADAKLLNTGKDEQTDLRLTQAEQTNQFDEIFIQTMKAQLADYQATIKKLHEASKTKTAKDQLNDSYQDAGLLIASQ